MKLSRYGVRDDVRKAMFANMNRIKFAESPGPQVVDSTSFTVETKGSEKPRPRIVRDDTINVEEGPQRFVVTDQIPNVEFKKSETNFGGEKVTFDSKPEKIRFKGGGTEQTYKTDYEEQPFIFTDYTEESPEEEKKSAFDEYIRSKSDTFKKSFKETLDKDIEDEAKKAGEYFGGRPKAIYEGVKSAPGKLAEEIGKDYKIIRPAVTHGAYRLGTAAGEMFVDASGRVVPSISELMNEGKSEFWQPPGYQPVWTGKEYKYQLVNRFPMEPFAPSRSMGIGMPPGVVPSVSNITLLPTLEAAKMFNEQYINRERGYGGADLRYTSKDVGITGEPPILFPRQPVPNFWMVGQKESMNWLMPPTEVRRGIGTKVPPRQTQKLLVPRISGTVVSTTPVVKEQKSNVSSNVKYTQLMPKHSLLMPGEGHVKKPTSLNIPRSVSGALSEQRRYETVVGEQGPSSPEAVNIQAKMQSKADYALRHTEPGSPGRYMLEKSGLSS